MLNSEIDNSLAGSIKAHKTLANQYGVPLLCYEGGQSLTAWSQTYGSNQNQALKTQANGDPRMGQVYKHLLDVWNANGGALFGHYSHIGVWDQWGSWGLLDSMTRAGNGKWDYTMAACLPAGDATLDGKVDYADFLIFKANYGGSGKFWEQGDFNHDGKVDNADYALLKANLSGLTGSQAADVAAFEASIGVGGGTTPATVQITGADLGHRLPGRLDGEHHRQRHGLHRQHGDQGAVLQRRHPAGRGRRRTVHLCLVQRGGRHLLGDRQGHRQRRRLGDLGRGFRHRHGVGTAARQRHRPAGHLLRQPRPDRPEGRPHRLDGQLQLGRRRRSGGGNDRRHLLGPLDRPSPAALLADLHLHHHQRRRRPAVGERPVDRQQLDRSRPDRQPRHHRPDGRTEVRRENGDVQRLRRRRGEALLAEPEPGHADRPAAQLYPAAGTTPPPPATTSYEAEATANTVTAPAARPPLAGTSGGSLVGSVGNGGSVTFNKVTVPTAGSYQVTVAYISGNARTASLSRNGGAATTVNFPATANWTSVGTITLTLTLNAGDNTLRFFNDTASVPDFDRIIVAAP